MLSHIIIIIFLILLSDFIFYSIYFCLKYNKQPLSIKTFDGYNQPYHPSVLYKKEGWNSYKYWMVLTPYPMKAEPYKDRWECPCIYTSNNGIDWTILKNCYPLDDLITSEIESRDFFSDPHLVIKKNTLECWYRITHRYNNDMDTYIIKRTSTDGINWSKREEMISPLNNDVLISLGDMVRSPAIIWEKEYLMWYVDNKKNIGQRKLCFSKSKDGKTWAKRINCILEGKETNPWHIDVSYLDNTYYLINYDLKDLTLWQSKDGIHFTFVKTLLKPSLVYGSFWSDGLYRSVLIKNDKEYLLYFSAYNETKRCIGLMTGKSPMSLKVKSCSTNIINPLHLIKIYLSNKKRLLSGIKHFIMK